MIAFDKRGMGLSDRDAGAYTIEGIADDMISVLDAVGAEQAAVFGVSEGGSAATMFAASHPERASALVEFGTYARVSAAPDYPQGVEIENLRRFLGAMAEDWGNPALLSRWAPSLDGDEEAAPLVGAPAAKRLHARCLSGADGRCTRRSTSAPSCRWSGSPA